jgi:hypothetical protein
MTRRKQQGQPEAQKEDLEAMEGLPDDLRQKLIALDKETEQLLKEIQGGIYTIMGNVLFTEQPTVFIRSPREEKFFTVAPSSFPYYFQIHGKVNNESLLLTVLQDVDAHIPAEINAVKQRIGACLAKRGINATITEINEQASVTRIQIKKEEINAAISRGLKIWESTNEFIYLDAFDIEHRHMLRQLLPYTEDDYTYHSEASLMPFHCRAYKKLPKPPLYVRDMFPPNPKLYDPSDKKIHAVYKTLMAMSADPSIFVSPSEITVATNVLIAKKHPEKEKGEEGIVKDGDAVTPQEVESMLLDLASDLSEPYSLIRENEKYRVNRQRRMFDFRLDYIARFQTEQANAHYLHDS